MAPRVFTVTAAETQTADQASTNSQASAAAAAATGGDDEFRAAAAGFVAESAAAGLACPAYGAILAPALYELAVRWQRHIFASGWAGLHWPTEFGGQGLSRAHTGIWLEECERADVAPYLNLQGMVLAGEAIMRTGTPEQRERFLRPTLAGDLLWCQLFSEPGAGSDLAGLSSAATPDGERFILNGQKVWSSNAQFADFGILMARTETDIPRHGGISFFLLDMTLDGIEVRPIKQMTGDEEFCEVFFNDVHVPADALLGGRGEGWGVAMAVLEDERGSAGATGIISLDRRLAAITAAARGRVDQVATEELMGVMSRGQLLSRLMERSGSDPTMAPVVKLLGAELGYDETGLSADLRGAEAMLLDETTERFLYAPGMRIAGGSNEIQRNIIGERVLGLPREPKG